MSIPTEQAGRASGVTSIQLTEMTNLALAVARNAHAPYSSFRVGAAILLTPGIGGIVPTIITGCNVENASFRLTTCAEQSAIAAAVALYGPSIRIQAVVLVNLNGAACSPCGACRQTIHEFSTPATRVFFPGTNGVTTEASIGELLPHAFLAQSFLP